MFLFRRKLREGTAVMISEMTQKAFSNYSGRVVSQPSYSLWFGLGKMCMFLGLFSLLVKPSLKNQCFHLLSCVEVTYSCLWAASCRLQIPGRNI